jgi:hypothetical protein
MHSLPTRRCRVGIRKCNCRNAYYTWWKIPCIASSGIEKPAPQVICRTCRPIQYIYILTLVVRIHMLRHVLMKLSWHLYLLLPILCLSPVNIHAQIQDNIHINGYMSMEFEKQLGDDGKGDKNASFDAYLIDLVWNINATDRLRIATDMTW